MSTLPPAMTRDDLETLRWATAHLEHPSLAARLTSVIGTPIEMAVNLLPRPLYKRVHRAADIAIGRALDLAVTGLDMDPGRDSRDLYYRALVAGTGAVGGLFGLLSLAIELPISTMLMLRSIAAIARAEGEDLNGPEARMACLEVLALGGRQASDDGAETGYYGVRLALALAVGAAVSHINEHGMASRGAPVLVGLVSVISDRFGAVVSEKLAAELMPVVGALGGGAVNLMFMSHFQEMARGHFVVRRLERKYGAGLVKAHYQALCRESSSGLALLRSAARVTRDEVGGLLSAA
jgi:EcsC protein family